MFARPRTPHLVAGVALIGAVVGFLSGPGAADAPPQPEALATAQPDAPPPGRAFPGFDPRNHRVEDELAVADLADGSTALLTIDPGLQRHVAGIYDRFDVPSGAFVALEPSTGRILAYVAHGEGPGGTDPVLDPSAPAASVFKVVTAAALLDQRVQPDDPVCYHGGARRLRLANIEDHPSRDRQCASLREALGGSVNSVFGKLADRHLDPRILARYASAFGFGHALPFDVPTRASPSEIPADRLEFARTAAGFWHNYLSPLHGAVIAGTIANGGEMMRPYVVDELIGAHGGSPYRAEPAVFRSVIPRSTARVLGRMMEHTVQRGTARRAFFDQEGRPFLPGIRVAGKTGTLASERPYRGYTWFVGFAPADEPTIAVAALVVNEPRWRIKASYVAREGLRYWLRQRGQ